MPAHHEINSELKIIFTTWEGDATDEACYEALKQYKKDIVNHPQYTGYNEVVSFANVAGVKVTASGLMELAKLAKTTERPGVYSKLAIVTKSSLANSFARLYATYRNVIQKSNKRMQIFNDEQDALDWLNSDE